MTESHRQLRDMYKDFLLREVSIADNRRRCHYNRLLLMD